MADVASNVTSSMHVFSLSSADLYGESGHLKKILKAQAEGLTVPTSQSLTLGVKELPINAAEVKALLNVNEHHSTCIDTKVASTVGLSFLDSRLEVPKKSIQEIQKAVAAGQPLAQQVEEMQTLRRQSKVEEILDPLCDQGFLDVLNDATEDFWNLGNGYIEVVRDKSNQIVGLHYLPADQVRIYLEDLQYNYHYEIGGAWTGTVEGFNPCLRRFAKFGDKDNFLRRMRRKDKGVTPWFVDGQTPETTSEVIHFRTPTSQNRWYGVPKWLAAVPSIELVECLNQYKFDFFNNRGVPEFMLFITGGKVDAKDWGVIVDAIKANIGKGNSHKSIAVNLANQDLKIELVKLAMDGGKQDDFGPVKESLALSIVTAHRVPPLLAGILIPGKLGASNELPNAIMAFQTLVIGPAQRLFVARLGKTLGNKELSGLDLEYNDFQFRTITEEINIGNMDTTSRMRETIPEAEAKGRKIEDGLKD